MFLGPFAQMVRSALNSCIVRTSSSFAGQPNRAARTGWNKWVAQKSVALPGGEALGKYRVLEQARGKKLDYR